MKKLFSVILVLVISLSLATTAFAAEYQDTASSWAVEAIESTGYNMPLRQDGTVAGELNFKADITRLEFVDMLIRWVDDQTDNQYILFLGQRLSAMDDKFVFTKNPARMDTSFYPVMTHTEYRILTATRLGITDGLNLNSFLTREQAATMIMRATKLVKAINAGALYREYELEAEGLGERNPGEEVVYGVNYWVLDVGTKRIVETVRTQIQAPSNTPDQGFADKDQISSWAKDGVNFAKANKIMNGTGGNNFSPKTNYTIEQAVVTLYNITPKAETPAQIAPVVEPQPEPTTTTYSDLKLVINGKTSTTTLSTLVDGDNTILPVRLIASELKMNNIGQLPVEATILEARQLLNATIELVGDTLYVTK